MSKLLHSTLYITNIVLLLLHTHSLYTERKAEIKLSSFYKIKDCKNGNLISKA